MLRKVLVLLLFSACGDTSSTPENTPQDLPITQEKQEQIVENKVWICYNVESEQHGKECSDACFSPDDDYSKYCWLLLKDECSGSQKVDWQRENCHFFD